MDFELERQILFMPSGYDNWKTEEPEYPDWEEVLDEELHQGDDNYDESIIRSGEDESYI